MKTNKKTKYFFVRFKSLRNVPIIEKFLQLHKIGIAHISTHNRTIVTENTTVDITKEIKNINGVEGISTYNDDLQK